MTGDEHSEINDAASADGERAAPVAWWWRALAPIGLPLVLWWIGSFFLRGDLGKWLDDYGFHLRDPATDTYKVEGLFKSPLPDFWRPLHMIVGQDLITLTWHKFWIAHAVCAGLHLLNVVLLFGVLRRLGIRRTVASVCGMVFLTLPIGYEAIFWPTTVSTLITPAIFMGLVLPAFLRFARMPAREPGKRGWWWGWGLAVVLFPLMFVIACFYEQALTMSACLPMLYVVVAPRLERLRDHVVRMVVGVGMALGGGLLYAGLLIRTASAGRRGGADTYTTRAGLADKLELVWNQATELVTMRAFLPGAVKAGWATMGEEWTGGMLAVALLVVTGAAWLSWRWRLIGMEQGEKGAGRSRASWRMGLVAMAGLAIFVCAWLPAVVIRDQWVASRLGYVPMIGAVLVVAAMLELVARMLSRRPRAQRGALMAVGVAAIPVCVAGAIALLGVQWSYQKRYRMDQAQLGVLKSLVPTPPAETVFMPMKLEDWPVAPATGSYRFDQFARGLWELQWSAALGVRQTYRNNSVHAVMHNRWVRMPLDRVTAESFVYSGPRFWSAFPKLPDGRHVVPWTHVVAFVVGKDQQLKLVERIVFKRKGEEVQRVELPQVMEAKERSPGAAGLFIREFVVELEG